MKKPNITLESINSKRDCRRPSIVFLLCSDRLIKLPPKVASIPVYNTVCYTVKILALFQQNNFPLNHGDGDLRWNFSERPMYLTTTGCEKV